MTLGGDRLEYFSTLKNVAHADKRTILNREVIANPCLTSFARIENPTFLQQA